MVPPGAPHTFENPGDDTVVLLNTFTPDLSLQYFRDLHDMIASGQPLSDEAVISVMARYERVPVVPCSVLPVAARQLAAGTILAGAPVARAAGVAVYARVSSADQRTDLDRQVARLVEHAAASQTAPAKVVCEVGSGLNGHRTKLLSLLRDQHVGVIVVEHRDRLARFGVEYLEAALAAQGRRLVVVEDAEVTDDSVRDMVEVLTSFCARLCGRRSARRRARAALAATETEAAA